MADPVLEVRDVTMRFPASRSLVDVVRRRPAGEVRAVDGIDLRVGPGEVLAVVGESGCGKSTTANLLLGLERPTSGQIVVMGTDIASLGRRGLQQLRRQVQIVFQDPYESLNPRRTVAETVAEPLRVHDIPRPDRPARVDLALRQAGLDPPATYLERFPHELSGGQRQRVCIAAALALQPKVLIADEPVSMLDVSTRAEILDLLASLAADHDVAIVMITHDLATVAAYSHRIAVMYLGRIVETGATTQVLSDPRHPYTQALLSVVPVPDPSRRRRPVLLTGEPPDASRIPSGCRFHPRCPVAEPRCAMADPVLVQVGPSHEAACLLLANTPSDTSPPTPPGASPNPPPRTPSDASPDTSDRR